jgi:hypothetical protein
MPIGLDTPEPILRYVTRLWPPNDPSPSYLTEFRSSNIEINSFVLQKLRWFMEFHPTTAMMSTYDGIDQTSPMRFEARPSQYIKSADFDCFALCNNLSCKSMFLTRPPVQALAVAEAGETAHNIPRWAPYIFSETGITFADFLQQYWQERLAIGQKTDFRQPVFLYPLSDTICSCHDLRQEYPLDEVTKEYHQSKGYIKQDVVPLLVHEVEEFEYVIH